MSSAVSNAGILATRRDGQVLIADEPTRVELTWDDVLSANGQALRIRWSASVACVDSTADRALLAERYLSDVSTLAVARVAGDLGWAMAGTVTAAVAAREADSVQGDATFVAAIETAARSAAFAAGLAVLPPFELSVCCPARDRQRRLDAARERLAELSERDEIRARSLADVTRALAESAGDPTRARQTVASLRLADPLDVLRATALVEPTWSSASPSLWIAAGTRLARVDPLEPKIADAPSLGDGLGPIRSVSRARIDGVEVLLVGARDGVHVVGLDGPVRVVRSFRHSTGTEFGFNAACFLAAERLLIATHSRAGIVAWRWDDAAESAHVIAVDGGARSAVAMDEREVVLLIGGRLHTWDRVAGVTAFAGNVRLFATSDHGASRWVREDQAVDARYNPAVWVEDVLDIAGIPRTVRPLAAGGLEMVDVTGTSRLAIGPATLAARSVAIRPGFVAAVGSDRTRIALIDLARPEAIAAELHVSAALGNRVADAAFA